MELTSPPETNCYFLTFRTYGTWLHGDRRGSVDRQSNVVGDSLISPAPSWEAWQRELMLQPPPLFSDEQRVVCDRAMHDIARHRGWQMLALNVRTNHVHAVVCASHRGERVMNDLKAFATRALREQGLIEGDRRVWARHGSIGMLSRPHDIESVCAYVVEQQGSQLGTVGEWYLTADRLLRARSEPLAARAVRISRRRSTSRSLACG